MSAESRCRLQRSWISEITAACFLLLHLLDMTGSLSAEGIIFGHVYRTQSWYTEDWGHIMTWAMMLQVINNKLVT